MISLPKNTVYTPYLYGSVQPKLHTMILNLASQLIFLSSLTSTRTGDQWRRLYSRASFPNRGRVWNLWERHICMCRAMRGRWVGSLSFSWSTMWLGHVLFPALALWNLIHMSCVEHYTWLWLTLGWANYIHTYIRCIHGVFDREVTIHAVIYGVHARFWPALANTHRF